MSKSAHKALVRKIYSLLSIALAFLSAVLLWYYNVGVHWRNGFFGWRTLFVVGIAYSFTYWFFARMYNAHKIGLYRLTELAFSQMLAYGITDFIFFVASFFWFHNFRKIRPSYYILAFFLQLFAISLIIFICNRLFAHYDEPRRIIIIYGNPGYTQLLKKIKAVKYRYRVMGCYPEDTPWEELCEAIRECADVYLYDLSKELRSRLIRYCDSIGHDLHMSLSIDDIHQMELELSHSLDSPFVRTKKAPVIWYYPLVKRLMDVVFSAAALVILSPVMLLVALCIKICDRGPVFYGQTRLTKGGKEFTIYKFRSMVVDAEKDGARLASKEDDRITPVGRVIRMLRLDELPQLINILRGDMTIVGPRPERPEIAAVYQQEVPEFAERLKVKAGLTGYAQVYGKYNTSPLDKLKMDLLYIANQSLTFDLQIIFYTIKILFIPDSTEGVDDQN
ncbi:MAG: exopolysaccharide biosynthesis polyprenyl glycosylphosphotransferase [Blautia sp.]|nr:exopolysaccharide biosynthesis polyprenyl glycosylphosphotransferase [Blautia sp.]